MDGTASYIDHYVNNVNHFTFNGTAWSTVTSNIDGAGGFSWGASAISENGTAVATWRASPYLYAAYFDGISWKSPETLNADTALAERAPVFVDSLGRYVIISIENYSEDFLGYHFDGTWHGPQLVKSWTYGSLDPAIAMNGAGYLVIASDYGTNDNLSVIFSRFSP